MKSTLHCLKVIGYIYFDNNFTKIKVNKKKICGIRNENKRLVRFAHIAPCSGTGWAT